MLASRERWSDERLGTRDVLLTRCLAHVMSCSVDTAEPPAAAGALTPPGCVRPDAWPLHGNSLTAPKSVAMHRSYYCSG
jgi:hypothetical protein